jgi:cystathionine gamma-synthase
MDLTPSPSQHQSPSPLPPSLSLSLSTAALHADESFNHATTDVAPALHVSTTFRYSSVPEDLVPAGQQAETLFADPVLY